MSVTDMFLSVRLSGEAETGTVSGTLFSLMPDEGTDKGSF